MTLHNKRHKQKRNFRRASDFCYQLDIVEWYRRYAYVGMLDEYLPVSQIHTVMLNPRALRGRGAVRIVNICE